MIPLQDVIPSRATPVVTLTLLATLTLILGATLLLSDAAARLLILSYGLVPANFSWPALLTSMFLHQGVLHAAVNLLPLWICGDNLEGRLGRGRFLLVFLVAGVASGLAAVRVAPDLAFPLVGAGGATGGVVGGYLVSFRRSRVLMLVPSWRGYDLLEIPVSLLVGFWMLAQALVAAGPTANGGLPVMLWIQLSGVALGGVLARLLRPRNDDGREWWNRALNQPPPDRRRTSRDTPASSASSASN